MSASQILRNWLATRLSLGREVGKSQKCGQPPQGYHKSQVDSACVESAVIQSVYTERYEWDEAKNLRNQRDHDGITFELAALVFEDEFCLIGADRIDSVTGEQRWHAIGAVSESS
jgi:hypothetical protein